MAQQCVSELLSRGVRSLSPRDTVQRASWTSVMSREPLGCFDDAPIDAAMPMVRDAQIRRLPLVDRERHLVGMLSLGDLAARAGATDVAGTRACICEPTASAGGSSAAAAPR